MSPLDRWLAVVIATITPLTGRAVAIPLGAGLGLPSVWVCVVAGVSNFALAGAMILLGLFLVIILRALDLAINAPRPFPSYLAIGVASYFTFHVVVNVAITTGLLPVTGLPLPLISYGGSSLLVSSFLLGLLLNVAARQYES